MKTVAPILLAAAIVVGWLFAHEHDYREALAMAERSKDYRAWLADHCIPMRTNERGIIERRADGSTQCAIYENAGPGSAPRLLFAEVRP